MWGSLWKKKKNKNESKLTVLYDLAALQIQDEGKVCTISSKL